MFESVLNTSLVLFSLPIPTFSLKNARYLQQQKKRDTYKMERLTSSFSFSAWILAWVMALSLIASVCIFTWSTINLSLFAMLTIEDAIWNKLIVLYNRGNLPKDFKKEPSCMETLYSKINLVSLDVLVNFEQSCILEVMPIQSNFNYLRVKDTLKLVSIYSTFTFDP